VIKNESKIQESPCTYSVCRTSINAETNVRVFVEIVLKVQENNYTTHEELKMNTVLREIKKWEHRIYKKIRKPR
jgi:hypothetical protein